MKKKILIGWKEWCSLPELGILSIGAKIDTGAKTSALHADIVALSTIDGQRFVEFLVCPLQRNESVVQRCRAAVIAERYVTSSSGHREKRLIIRTPVILGSEIWPIEITLTNRETMAYRMLLGRGALRSRFLVDPSKSYCQGRPHFLSKASK